MKRIYILLLLTPITLQGQFSIDTELRPRFEFRDGHRQLTTDTLHPAAFISQRTRLNLNYNDTNMQAGISFQDVRVWGDEMQLQNVPRIALHEAWFDIKFMEDLSVKIGRQELVYDDHRLLGNVNWTQQARSHDAIVAKYSPSDWKLHLGGSFYQSNQNLFSTSYTADNYKGLFYLWGERNIVEDLKFSFMGISDVYQQHDTLNVNYFRHTVGGNLFYKSDIIEAQGTGYYQLGKTQQGRDISASMFSGQAYFKSGGFKAGAGTDFLSGNDAETDSYNAFNTLYATNHKFYGYMDYFLNVPDDTRYGGLIDIYIKIQYAIDKFNFSLDYHKFSTQQNILLNQNTIELENNLASEIDFTGKYKFTDDITFQIGYSYLIPAETLKTIQNIPDGKNSQWFWATINVSSELFKGDE